METISAIQAADWCNGVWHPHIPVHGFGLVIRDSREACPGALFFALKGEHHDGHDFLPAVQAAGTCSVVQKGHTRPLHEGCVLEVQDVREALGKLAAGYRRLFSIPIIGITGSVGKTTTKEMIAHILSTAGETVRTPGNFNNEIGLPLSLFQLSHSTRFGVLEMGMSHPGEIAPLCRILQPTAGVVTKIGEAHIAAFSSVEQIAREKSELPAAVPADGFVVLDMDDPFFAILKERCAARVITCSLTNEKADYLARWTESAPLRMDIFETQSGETCELILPAPGRHMAENALKAVAVARYFDIPWPTLQAVIPTIQAGPMRWETVHFPHMGITVINDAYNANPVSMRAALRGFGQHPGIGNRWIALGGMLELGDHEREAHIALGEDIPQLGSWAGIALVGSLASWVAQGLKNKGWSAEKMMICETHADAAKWLQSHMSNGDSLLIKGSRGSRMERVISGWE